MGCWEDTIVGTAGWRQENRVTIPLEIALPGPCQEAPTRASPSPGHWAPPWGWGQTEGSLGRVPTGGPSLEGPCSWGAGDWPRGGVTGAGADGSRGLAWGPGSWAGWGETLGGWARTVKPVSALRAMATYSVLKKKKKIMFNRTLANDAPGLSDRALGGPAGADDLRRSLPISATLWW